MTIMIIQTRYHKMSIDPGNQNKVSVILQNSRGRAYVPISSNLVQTFLSTLKLKQFVGKYSNMSTPIVEAPLPTSAFGAPRRLLST